MKNKTNWKVTKPKFMTHLVADNYNDYLFGKALCGIKFQRGNIIQNVLAGSKVNCSNCLVKVAWAKRLSRKRIINKKGSTGYTETTYVLLKDLKQSNLKSNGQQDYSSETIFKTSTDNGR